MNLYNQFLKVAETFPNNKAITDMSESLTYNELKKKVDAYILQINAPAHSCAVIYLPKSCDIVAWQLALNAKNIAFITLEYDQEKRKEDCVEQAKPSLIISLDKGKLHIIYSKEYKYYNENISYIVFSSGSTGKPKMIYMKDSPVINVVKQQAKIISFTENSKFLWLLNSAFDASLSDIYLTLLSGGHLIVTQHKATETKKIFELIRNYNITHTDLPPVVFSIWLKRINELPNNLQHVIFGGEPANEIVTKKLLAHVSLYNAYGPTETTICASLKKVNEFWTYKNVGVPLDGVLYKIVNKELHIGGEHCAVGYDNELLNEKFYIEDGIRWFKSGDIFSTCNDEYYYEGRRDRQFKYNGQLICPEEIEYLAKQHGATNSQIIFKEKIFLYYDGELLIEEFEKNIVSWMKPHFYQKIENIEQNVNQNWKLKINE